MIIMLGLIAAFLSIIIGLLVYLAFALRAICLYLHDIRNDTRRIK